MPTVQVKSQVSLDELLNGVSQLETPELENFVSQVLTIRAQRVGSSLSKRESELLQKINQGLAPQEQQRYDELTFKRHEQSLTPKEHAELLELVEQIEQADAERAALLGTLAQLRRVPVKMLMKELGISSRKNG